jgi:hypothetical protein
MANIDLACSPLCCSRLRSPNTFRCSYSAPLLPNPKRQRWPRLTRAQVNTGEKMVHDNSIVFALIELLAILFLAGFAFGSTTQPFSSRSMRLPIWRQQTPWRGIPSASITPRPFYNHSGIFSGRSTLPGCRSFTLPSTETIKSSNSSSYRYWSAQDTQTIWTR